MSLRKASYQNGLARKTTCRAMMQEYKAMGFSGIPERWKCPMTRLHWSPLAEEFNTSCSLGVNEVEITRNLVLSGSTKSEATEFTT